MWNPSQPHLPEPARPAGERRRKVRIAVGQLDFADLYLAAVENLELGDRPVETSIRALRADLHGLRRRLDRLLWPI